MKKRIETFLIFMYVSTGRIIEERKGRGNGIVGNGGWLYNVGGVNTVDGLIVLKKDLG